jgi:hypothetical protein
MGETTTDGPRRSESQRLRAISAGKKEKKMIHLKRITSYLLVPDKQHNFSQLIGAVIDDVVTNP